MHNNSKMPTVFLVILSCTVHPDPEYMLRKWMYPSGLQTITLKIYFINGIRNVRNPDTEKTRLQASFSGTKVVITVITVILFNL